MFYTSKIYIKRQFHVQNCRALLLWLKLPPSQPTPERSRLHQPPPHPLPGLSHSSAQRKNEPEPVLRCVQGPDYCLGHIGLPVVTMSTRAFVHGTLTNSYYSLCPFLSSGANEMIYQQELRTRCQVLGRGRRLGKSFYEIKAWSPKDTHHNLQCLSHSSG